VDFELGPEERELAERVRAFAAEALAPRYQADHRAGRLGDGLHAALAGAGLMGLRIPRDHGGLEVGAVATGAALEAMARANFNACYLVLNAALISDILVANGDERQRPAWLEPLAGGEVVPALCLTEPAHGSDAASIELEGRRDGDGWRLVGEKASVALGVYAHRAVVFARTGGPGARGVTAFWVPLDDAFVERRPYDDVGNRAVGRAALTFDGLRAGPEDVIGGEGLGFVQVMRGFDYSRALIGLMCLAAASASVDEALEHARTRQAFGQPIGRFQAVSFPLVEYATQLRAARLLCFQALWLKDRGQPHTIEANMAKWWAPRLSVDAAHQALLTFGHHGWSEELPLAQRMRDVMGLEIGDGTAQITKLVVARALLGREAAP
jgi:cyclohexanecarboxyl-CoA dehydrogenase